MYFLRFEQISFLYVLLPLFCCILLVRKRWYRQVLYNYSLGNQFKKHNFLSTHPYKKIFNYMRFVVLLFLIFLIAKPQLVDSRSKITVEGIDIMLVLDASGSMNLRDDDHDDRSRFSIAKEEAIRFIEKRENDAIGLVIFGKYAVSRCPLTTDKPLLNDIVKQIEIGSINSEGTVLITAMVNATNRLKHSKAKSKIIIVLTDGEPSEGDIDPSIAIEIAKRFGIKIYTVGIGSQEDKMLMHPLYGLITMPKVNKELLSKIADETGGQCFMAYKAHDMRIIYDTIDALEKTEYDTPLFSKYHDVFLPFTVGIIFVIIFELLLSTFIWFAL